MSREEVVYEALGEAVPVDELVSHTLFVGLMSAVRVGGNDA